MSTPTTNGKPPRSIPSSPKALEGTPQAIRQASILLETISGLRTTGEASEELGVALSRYYQLETRGLQGMIDALEPRKRGRKRAVEDELSVLRAEVERLRKEVLRYQALHRVSQRALALSGKQAKAGVPEKAGKASVRSKKKARKTTRRRKTSRGERVLGELRGRVEGFSGETGNASASSTDDEGGPAPLGPGGTKEDRDGR